ncbi:hypothetical protein [uncultured Porticoccus sp.]|uniref:hypothetical protein n=1 Tax=uncultured Porticoccus sp. TaxID=1256050 RepID=UPI00260E78F1|nr:hypothetical protein [uncultured Porticoccus sp.]
MTNEEIQLLSDTVKVGFPILGTLLGGAIGALSTYFITRLNHKNENAKEALRKRHELILKAAGEIAEFEHLIGTYAFAISNHVQGLEGEIDMEAARQNLISQNQPLRRARMILKILNLKEAERHLEEYLEFTREVIAKGPKLKPERASELAKIVTRGPVLFYESLAPELSANDS